MTELKVMPEMFCFQCEQTAKGTGCTGKAGVCAKSSEVANLQDDLISALVDLAFAAEGKTSGETDDIISDALFRTITNVDFSAESVKAHIEAAVKETEKFGYKGEKFKLSEVWIGNEDIRSLKSLILFGLKGIAAYAYHAKALGYEDPEVYDFMYEALKAIGSDMGMEGLLPVVLGAGEANLKCMKILDQANTETYGVPEPNTVSMKIEKGPFKIGRAHV